MAKGDLTKMQRLFVAEYLKDLNATQAAIRAGYSAKTADRIGPELLGKTCVAMAIQKAMQKREKRIEVSQDDVIRELSRIAFGDLRDAVKWGPGGVALKDSSGLTSDQAAAISEVAETGTKGGGSQRIKRHDKVKALELLGKHLGMWTDKVEHSGNLNAEIQIFRIPDNGRSESD